MCLLYFSLFKTVLNWGGKDMQKDGRGCVEVKLQGHVRYPMAMYQPAAHVWLHHSRHR